MKKIRCKKCKKLLAIRKENKIEIKCPRCKTYSEEQIIEAPEARKQRVSENGRRFSNTS